MAFRRFRKQFEYKNEAGERVTVPRNWAGELPDDVAKAADDAKVTLVEKASSQPADTDQEKPLDKWSKDDVVAEAARRNLTIKPSANKGDILMALRVAAEPFAKPLAELDEAGLKAEADRRGVALTEGADAAAIRAALTLAAEDLPA